LLDSLLQEFQIIHKCCHLKMLDVKVGARVL